MGVKENFFCFDVDLVWTTKMGEQKTNKTDRQAFEL